MKKKSGEKSERDKLLAKLHEAATDGKLGLLRALLRRHPEEVNTPCGFSKSPALVTAASKGIYTPQKIFSSLFHLRIFKIEEKLFLGSVVNFDH